MIPTYRRSGVLPRLLVLLITTLLLGFVRPAVGGPLCFRGWILAGKLKSSLLAAPEQARQKTLNRFHGFLEQMKADEGQLKQDAQRLEALLKKRPGLATTWLKLAEEMLNRGKDKKGNEGVLANWQHVDGQHLYPLEQDAAELAKKFNINPEVLRLLMMLHDLGKVQVPPDMLELLNVLYPGKPIAINVLAHEWGSMHWLEELGKKAGVGPEEIAAAQRLIANHNFGIDPTDERNASLLENFWPANFRKVMIPRLQELFDKMGWKFDLFPEDRKGSLQYGRSQNIYSDLLSLYDRWAPRETRPLSDIPPNGLANVGKFLVEGWLYGRLPPHSFGGSKIEEEMLGYLAEWEAQRIATWRQAYAHVGEPNPLEMPESPERKNFSPIRRQDESAAKLRDVIQWISEANKGRPLQEGDKRFAYYRTRDGKELYRVVMDSPKKSHVEKLTHHTDGKEVWEDQKEAGVNPYELYVKLLSNDPSLAPERAIAPLHRENLRAYAMKEQRYIVMRLGNPFGIRYHDPHSVKYRPKTADVHLKTATAGEYAGLVVEPKRRNFATNEQFEVAREIWKQEWPKLKKVGEKAPMGSSYQLGPDGVVRDGTGKALYSDYDLSDLFDERGNRVEVKDGTPEIRVLNRAIDPDLMPLQHGSMAIWNDSRRSAAPPVLVFTPNGKQIVLRTEEEMKAYYKSAALHGGVVWSWPFGQ